MRTKYNKLVIGLPAGIPYMYNCTYEKKALFRKPKVCHGVVDVFTNNVHDDMTGDEIAHFSNHDIRLALKTAMDNCNKELTLAKQELEDLIKRGPDATK